MSTVDVQTRGGGGTTRYIYQGRIHAAHCSACQQDVLFLDGKMIDPPTSEAPPPTEDMPPEIIDEYREAAAILPGSPRGAAALLRLAVEKLLPILRAEGKNINEQIGFLVAARTLPRRVSEALDTLRVIGNETVHPGTIDLRDDPETALGLFRLLNFIVEKAITEPKHADEMFAKLPQNKRDGIANRDKGKQQDPSGADE